MTSTKAGKALSFATLDQQEDEEVPEDEGRDEQKNVVDSEPPMKVKSYKKGNELLEGVQHFLEATLG